MSTDQPGTKLTNIILTAGLLFTLLAACAPTGTVSPEPAEAKTATAAPTATATAAPTFTATPSPTPTATLSPEEAAEAAQEQIRAEILAAGVNLDDLANSKDEWTSSHKAIETIQNSIDNNFGRETEGFITTVVIGLEAVENLEELEQAITTDTGWKLTTFAKLAYKDVNGDWQIIKVPLNAYNAESDLLWIKNVGNRSAPNFIEGVVQPDENGDLIIPLVRTWISLSSGQGYHSGVGSFIKLFTAWPEDPKYANNDCALGDPPRYSEEQLIEFRQTGDPSIFGYKDRDGYDIFWPIVTFHANLSDLSSYNQE